MAFINSPFIYPPDIARLPHYRGQEFTPAQRLQPSAAQRQGLYRSQVFTVSQPRIATVRRTAIYRGVRVPVS